MTLFRSAELHYRQCSRPGIFLLGGFALTRSDLRALFLRGNGQRQCGRQSIAVKAFRETKLEVKNSRGRSEQSFSRVSALDIVFPGEIPMNVNDKAPDFTLQDENGKEIALKDLLGKTMVLYFYPRADTPG